jgi:hypothetical protein
MTAALRKNEAPASVPAVDVFQLRCEARAFLCAACVYDLHEAVDVLQADAERTGLVDEIGQDAVQRLMADTFASVPRISVHQDKKGTSSIGTLFNPPMPQPGAARSTLMAADYLVRQNDPARFKRWLAQHTRAERIAIKNHIQGKTR